MTASTVGRPKYNKSSSAIKASTRELLLSAALTTFSQKPYDQVSTREIARAAEVDAAMIRYYFGSKAGLFESVVRESVEPMIHILRQTNNDNTSISPQDFIKTYYQTIGSKPGLPKLIFQTLHQESQSTAVIAIKLLFEELVLNVKKWLNSYLETAQTRTDIAPDLIYISTIGCVVFPLIAPPFIQEKLGVDLSENGLQRLAAHNSSFILNGLFESPTTEKEPL